MGANKKPSHVYSLRDSQFTVRYCKLDWNPNILPRLLVQPLTNIPYFLSEVKGTHKIVTCWIIAFFPRPRKWFLQCAYAWALQLEHREGSARSVLSWWKSWYSLKAQMIWTCSARRLRWVSKETFFPLGYNLGSQKSVLCGYFDLITVVWVFRKFEDWCV